jgi:tetratricopeptide (TPR) repeat protein
MPKDQSEYDIFLSYARADNREGWIRQYLAALCEVFRNFTGGRELTYFWDTERIPEFTHWEAEIFNKGITRSKLFLAFLSPNYFISEVCRREWRAWVEREIGLHIFTEGASPIYIVEIPAMFGKPMPSEHETARQIAELCQVPLPQDIFLRDAENLVRQFRRRQLHVVEPFYKAGLKALQEADLRKQLQTLAKSVTERVETLELAAASESTVPTYNPKFTGRVDELVELRSMLVDAHTGVVAGVHGLGGIGKTELAFTFAHAYASVYPGGRYYVRCDGKSTLADAFVNLEKDPFHDEISDAERNDPQKNFNAVYRCLKKRLKDLGPVLLVLDNVSDPAILHPSQTNEITTLGPKLHLLATTRLPQAIGIKTLMLGEMKRDDAIALLEKYRPFRDEAERAAAETIVEKLGGFALAVELVAGRLAVRESATYAGVLSELGLDQLDSIAVDPDVKLMRHSHEQRLRMVLGPTLAELSPEAKCLLQYAALLPPDRVVFPWLKQLVTAEFPALGVRGRDGSDPWFELVRSLFRRSLFTGVIGRELPTTARLHRLIGDFLREDMPEERTDKVSGFLTRRTDQITDMQMAPEEWELDALIDTIPHWLQREHDRGLANMGTFLSDYVMRYRNLPLAQTLLKSTHACLQLVAVSDPGNAAWQRDLSVSQIKLGDLAMAQGNLTEAQRLYADSFRIAQRLAESDPGNAAWQRDLWMSFGKLGDIASATGDLPKSRELWTNANTITQRLAESDPGNAAWQRDLSASLIKLGDLAVAQGNLPDAQQLFAESLRIFQRLAESDPGNAAWQRDLSVSLGRLGDVAVALGNLPEAQQLFGESLRIAQRLAESDPGNAEWQRDLSASLIKLGDLAVALGNLPEAQQLFGESLRIFQRMAESDPGNAAWQRGLSVSLEKLGDVAVAQGNLPDAQQRFADSLRIRQRLAESDPGNAEWQRDLYVSHWKMANLLEKQQKPDARQHWQQAHDILAGMVSRGLHVSLQDLGFLEQLKRKLIF